MPQLFSMFLCHNSQDKEEVESIAKQLEERGKICWLDRYEIPPGTRWKAFVRDDLSNIGSLGIFFGPHGISEGQAFEIAELVPLMEERNGPVVPVVLGSHGPGKPGRPSSLPEDLTWVDFRIDFDPIQQLIWGIDRESPYRTESIAAYYRDTVGLEGEALHRELGRILQRGHKAMIYLAPRNISAVYDLFADPVVEGNIIRFVDQVSIPATVGGRRSWHMDQIWPRAYGFRELKDVQGDLHNIVPADPFHNIKERGADRYYDKDLDHGAPETKAFLDHQETFDPRGVIARACLYMAVRYNGDGHEPDLQLISGDKELSRDEPYLTSLKTLLYWHKLAKVSIEERDRNNRMFEYQGNRNPFVDIPELVIRLWKKDVPYGEY
ncbi:MAG: endonuclease [Acidobacteria bacterium]|nr:endonuclease [Acidobacteriota bacterium]